ncbi:lactate racemase n-terminal domain [Holotrichia oblita]|nr:lactate racemase n-terminal domain [Holotrichia oblita]
MNPLQRNLLQNEERLQRNYELRLQKRVLRDQVIRLIFEFVIELFRLNKDLVQNMLIRVVPVMQAAVRNRRITAQERILVAIRIFATDNYQPGVGEEYLLSISQYDSECVLHNMCIAAHIALENEANVNIQHEVPVLEELPLANENILTVGRRIR